MKKVTFFTLFGLSLSAALACTSLSALATEATPEQEAQDFAQCLVSLQEKALAAGVTKASTLDVLAKAQRRPKIISYDRGQPEFLQTFSDYYAKRVTDWRVSKGRTMLAKHQEFLDGLTKKYGVPGQYLVAFWGLETNFGSIKGKLPVINSLATLACDKRRSDYFSGELIQALLLIERENIDVKDMIGSWAGAMGHTQFMPTAYMTYAKDGDQDGKIDLFNNEQDALESAANFLQSLGWQAGFRWGREVQVAPDFDFSLAGKSSTYPLSFWREQGLKKVNGQAIESLALEASLLIPASYQASIFLVYPNYEVILRWNNSEYYGIAVGTLADRIAGAGRLSKPLPELPNYTKAQMQSLQNKLNELGFDTGKPDGILGPGTRKGVRGFQQKLGILADGYPSKDLFEMILSAPAT